MLATTAGYTEEAAAATQAEYEAGSAAAMTAEQEQGTRVVARFDREVEALDHVHLRLRREEGALQIHLGSELAPPLDN